MVSERIRIDGEIRPVGLNLKRDIFSNKRIPAVLYGKSIDVNLTISVDAKSFSSIISTPVGRSRLYSLVVDGKTYDVVVKDVVFHAITDEVLHVDFFCVHGLKKIEVKVPIRILNKDICQGVKKGGSFRLVSYFVELSTSVAEIQEKIDVDVANLGLGGQIWLRDLKLPPSASFKSDKLIVKVGGKNVASVENKQESAS